MRSSSPTRRTFLGTLSALGGLGVPAGLARRALAAPPASGNVFVRDVLASWQPGGPKDRATVTLVPRPLVSPKARKPLPIKAGRQAPFEQITITLE
jgi:hypothetical protein